jgi:hypothetical protein
LKPVAATQAQVMIRRYFKSLRTLLVMAWKGVRRLCHITDLYLRLSWPVVLGQFVLWYLLTRTGQGSEILLESVVTPPGTVGAGFLSFCGINFGFFISALAFSWIAWMMTRSVISLAPNRLQELASNSVENFASPEDRKFAHFFSYKMPCLTSIIFLVFVGVWLTLKSDAKEYNSAYVILTLALVALFIRVFWERLIAVLPVTAICCK